MYVPMVAMQCCDTDCVVDALSKLVGFQCLKLFNLEDNYLTDWTVVLESLASLPSE